MTCCNMSSSTPPHMSHEWSWAKGDCCVEIVLKSLTCNNEKAVNLDVFCPIVVLRPMSAGPLVSKVCVVAFVVKRALPVFSPYFYHLGRRVHDSHVRAARLSTMCPNI